MTDEKYYFRYDVERYVDVECSLRTIPSVCWHNYRINYPCPDCLFKFKKTKLTGGN